MSALIIYFCRALGGATGVGGGGGGGGGGTTDLLVNGQQLLVNGQVLTAANG